MSARDDTDKSLPQPKCTTREYPLHGDDLEAIVNVFNAEYKVLRAEIALYHNHQKQTINFVFLVMAAMFGVIGGILAIEDGDFVASIACVFLLFPIVYMFLSLLYADRTLRIIRIADYIHNYLRNKVNMVTGEQVWQWEIYKRRTKIFSRALALFLDRARWAAFLLPSILALVLFFLFDETGINKTHEYALIVIDGLALITSAAVIFITEETTGIELKPTGDLDTDPHNTA